MAYAASVSYKKARLAEKAYTIVTIVESDLTLTTHEYTFDAPAFGSIVFHRAVFTAGTGNGTVVDPSVGEATGATSVWANGTAAATTRNTTSDAVFVTGSTGQLFGRSVCDNSNGGTASITTVIVLQEGHV